MSKFRFVLAALMSCAVAVLPSHAQDISLQALDRALASGEWQTATNIAAALDAHAGAGDVMAAYAAAVRFAANGQCAEAATLADFVINAVPLFPAPYTIAYRCHSALGNRAAAVQRLESLAAMLPQGPEREIVAQLLQNEQARDRPAFSAYATVAPSSNVNRQTDATTIDGGFWGPGTIPEEARGQAGVLFTAGGSMAVHLASLDNLQLSGVLRTDIRYSTADHVFEPSFTAELPVTFRPANAVNAVVAPYVTVGFANDEHSRTEGGVRGTVSLPLNAQNRLALSLRVAVVDRPLNPARSGFITDGAASVSSSIASNMNLTTTLRALYDHTDDEILRTLELTARTRLDTLFDGGLLLALEGMLGQRYHWRPAPFVVGNNQVDTFATVRAEASHRELTIGPFMPTLYYQYSKSWSDNVFYTYDSHDVGLTLRAAF